MSFQDLTIFSCYLRLGLTIQEFITSLSDLDDAIRARGNASIILAGDFNAWHVEWGSRVSNPRGRALSDLASSLGLILANSGTAPTFRRGAATSIIDITFYRGVALRDWRVSEAESLSDHNYVLFSIVNPAQVLAPPEPHPGANCSWTVKKLDGDALSLYLASAHFEPPAGLSSVEKALTTADQLDPVPQADALYTGGKRLLLSYAGRHWPFVDNTKRVSGGLKTQAYRRPDLAILQPKEISG